MHFRFVLFLLMSSFILPNTALSQDSDDEKKLSRTLPKKISKKKSKTEKKAQKKRRKKKRPSFDADKSFKVQYGSSPWNKNSKEIESAAILVKDRKTGKMAQINLEETEPDSSVFSGNFRLNWGDTEKISPDVYIPPQRLRNNKDWIEQVGKMIKTGRIKRKPFLMQRGHDGQHVMEVFDTGSQARKAYKTLQEARNLKDAQENAQKLKAKLDQKKALAAAALFEAAKLAELKKEQERLAREALAREAERVRLEQLEKQKAQERLRKARAYSAEQKRKRKTKAAKIAELAMKKYMAGKFEEAVGLFEKSIELDPSNDKYLFQYGVALYKTQNYNKAIVILNSARGSGINIAERDYFIALSYLRLKEYDKSLATFEKVKQSKDKVLGPSASFYQGKLLYDTQKYEEAKPRFEYVLDHSSDPRLDEKAEQYIERIAGILYFAEQQRTKFFFTGTLGLQYDSNILFSSDSSVDEGTATGEGGGRVLGISGNKWRPIYTKQHEFSTNLDLVYYYSFDSVFTSADPFLVTFTTPYVYKGTLFGKGYKMNFSPGYEVLFMDVEETGTRESILTSALLSVHNSLVLNSKWFMDLKIDYRVDDSSINEGTENDSTGNTLKVTNTHTFILDKANTQMAIGNLGYTKVNNDGTEVAYNRIDLSGSYIRPIQWWNWKMSWVSTLGLFTADYSQSSNSRKDSNYSINSSLSKPLGKHWTTGFSAGYTINSSNIEDNTYKQWNVMTTMSYDYSF